MALISTIPTPSGTFSIDDDMNGTITITGPESAMFTYPFDPLADPSLQYQNQLWASARHSALMFVLNYSNATTSPKVTEGLLLHALKQSGNLEDIVAQIRTGETLQGLADNQ